MGGKGGLLSSETTTKKKIKTNIGNLLDVTNLIFSISNDSVSRRTYYRFSNPSLTAVAVLVFLCEAISQN